MKLESQAKKWWEHHGDSVLTGVIMCMAAAASWRLANALPGLLWEIDGMGAFDLKLRHREVHRWFAGMEVYGDVERGDYPPASYLILWPMLGWLALDHARLLWAATSVTALLMFGYILAREAGASSWRGVCFVSLLPFSVYATSATIHLGQLGNHVIVLILVGLLLLFKGRGRWWEDGIASAFLVAALVKPTFTAPFIWIVCFAFGRLRPMLFVSGGYLAITLLSITFQQGDLSSSLFGWLERQPQALEGHVNVHKWLTIAGLRGGLLSVSLVSLAAFGGWAYRYRSVDPWVLIAISALVARFWIHHRLYDDMLLILPMVPLFRFYRRHSDGKIRLTAGIMLAAMWLTLHGPAGILDGGSYLSATAEFAQSSVWLAVLVFLVSQAMRGIDAPMERASPPINAVSV